MYLSSRDVRPGLGFWVGRAFLLAAGSDVLNARRNVQKAPRNEMNVRPDALNAQYHEPKWQCPLDVEGTAQKASRKDLNRQRSIPTCCAMR